MKTIALLLLILIPFTISAQAAESCCPQTGLCVDVRPDGRAFNFFFTDRTGVRGAHYLLRLQVTAEGYRSDITTPAFFEVETGRESRLLRLEYVEGSAGSKYNFFYEFRPGKLDAAHDPKARYVLPFAPDKAWRDIQAYDGPCTHKGEWKYSLDWDMPIGSEVRACRDGLVVGIVDRFADNGRLEESLRSHTNYINIEHTDGTIGEYCHIMQNGARVRVGQRVRAGELLGLSGNSGYSGMPHLHFNVCRYNRQLQRETIPVLFQTATAPQGETLMPNSVYHVWQGGQARPVLVADPASLTACTAVENGHPRGTAQSFAVNTKVLLFVSFLRDGPHTLRYICVPPAGMGNTLDWSFPVPAGNRHSWGEFTPWAAGRWRIQVMCGGQQVGSLELDVR
jgi:murein DD-endopeptidase MepM/ murein hydrolase activator NlpD